MKNKLYESLKNIKILLSNKKYEIYRDWYENPKYTDFQKQFHELIILIEILEFNMADIDTEEKILNFKRDFGIFFSKLVDVETQLLRYEANTKKEIERQRKKYKTLRNLKTILKIMWKGVILLLGFSRNTE